MNPVEVLTERVTGILEAAVSHTPNILLAVLILIATWLLGKLVRRIIVRVLPKGEERRSLRLAIRKLAVISIWLLGLALTAVVLFPSVEPGSMLAGLGLGSVAIGFAFKDIFENFFAGMLILFRHPFRINDYIEVEGIEGQVEDITIRDTLVRQTDGQPVIIPNSMLFKNPVRVRTDQDFRRVSIICGIAYGEDIARARDIIQQAVDAAITVNSDKPVQVFANAFGSSSIDFEVAWWTGSTPLDVRSSRDQVVEGIKAALDDAGVEIPFPYRTLTFGESLKVEHDDGEEN